MPTVAQIVIRSMDIGYVYTLYFFLSFIVLMITETIIGPCDHPIDTPVAWLIIELLIIFWVYGIVAYLLQLMVQQIPFPLDGIAGFTHQHSDDLNNAWIFGYIFLTCSINIQDRLIQLYNKLMGTNYPLCFSSTTPAGGGAAPFLRLFRKNQAQENQAIKTAISELTQ